MACGNISLARGIRCIPNLYIYIYICIFIYIYVYLLPHHRLYIEKNMCVCVCVCICICIYIYTYIFTHISDSVQTVYELPLLPNSTAVKHFYTKLERCEVLTGYLSLGRRSDGGWANTWHWTERFRIFFPHRKQQQLSYCHIFFLIAFLEEAFITNIA